MTGTGIRSMKYRLIFFLLFLMKGIVLSLETPEQDYDLLVWEVRLLAALSGQDTSLLDSAKAYKEAGDTEIANIFLEMMIEEAGQMAVMEVADPEPATTESRPIQWTLGTGVDFNRQEFEIENLEDDSILVEEIQKPFIATRLRIPLSGGIQGNAFDVTGDLRYDKENLKTDFNIVHRFTAGMINTHNRFGMIYDDNRVYEHLGYFELYSDGSLYWDMSAHWLFRLQNLLRLKRYRSPSETIPDFFREQGNLELKYANRYRSIGLSYDINVNESIDYLHNDFREQTSTIRLNGFLGSHIRNDIRMGYRDNVFNLVLSDSSLSNRSKTFFNRIYMKMQVGRNWEIDTDYAFDYKWYNEKTEQDPDYMLHTFRFGFINHYIRDWDVKTGIIYENRSHRLKGGLNERYITEQDYREHGYSLGVNYSGGKEIFLSMEVSHTRRTYPDNQESRALSLYSTRSIWTLFLYVQVPVMENVRLNVLGSYDNDRDVDIDNNDMRSSFFTAELQYLFH